MIKKVEVWQTTDGTLFHWKEEAEAYEEDVVFNKVKKESPENSWISLGQLGSKYSLEDAPPGTIWIKT